MNARVPFLPGVMSSMGLRGVRSVTIVPGGVCAKTYRPDDYLADYARHLSTVEIDQWFWSLFPGGITLPSTDTVKQYAESVPDDFRFTVKAPNAITLTHYYRKQPKGATDSSSLALTSHGGKSLCWRRDLPGRQEARRRRCARR